jgi:hypothetical protein
MEVPYPFWLSQSLGDRERPPELGAGAPSESETSVMAEASISTLWSLLLKLEETGAEKDMVR